MFGKIFTPLFDPIFEQSIRSRGPSVIEPIVATAPNGVYPGNPICATGGVPSGYTLDGDDIALGGDDLIDYVYRVYVNGVLVPGSEFIGCGGLVPSTAVSGDIITVRDLDGNESNPLVVAEFAIWRSKEEGFVNESRATPITFSRASNATRWTSVPALESVGNNILRIDHDAATGALFGLLAESQKVNLVQNSQKLFGASAAQTGGSVIAGRNSELFATATAGRYFNDLVGSNGDFTYSQYIRCISGTSEILEIVIKDRQTDSIKARTTFTPTSEYKRYFVTGTTTGANTGLRAEIHRTFSANGAAGGDGVYELSEAQVESGGISSLIPTSGSQATRQADSLVVSDMSPWFDPTGGIFFVKVRAYPGSVTSAARRIFEIGSGNNVIFMTLENTSVVRPYATIGLGSGIANSNTGSGSSPASQTQWEYLALSYSTTNGSFFARKTGTGAAAVSANIGNFSGVMPASMAIASNLNGHVAHLEYRPGQFSQADTLALLNSIP